MADTWISDITHVLDEKGETIKGPPQARKLGVNLAAIIVMASYPDPEYPPEYEVLCHRRPKRKPCLTEIAGGLTQKRMMWFGYALYARTRASSATGGGPSGI